jgi:hypothetical protein
MRIAGPHHGAAVFEYLYVVDVFEPGQFPKLFDPGLDNEFDLIPRHRRQREIVTRRKANHAANSRFSFGDQQAFVVNVETSVGGLRFQGREIILENEGGGVLRIADSSSPRVARTKVASGIVGGLGSGRKLRYLSLPRTRGAMGRN